MVNVQADGLIPTDLHQHRLYAAAPGQWETVLVNINDLVRTNRGKIAEPQSELLRRRVKSVGVSLIDRTPGPFELCVGKIWATNGLDLDASFQVRGLRGRRASSVFGG